MMKPMSDGAAAGRHSRWPRFDLPLVLVIVLAIMVFVLLTLPLWRSH